MKKMFFVLFVLYLMLIFGCGAAHPNRGWGEAFAEFSIGGALGIPVGVPAYIEQAPVTVYPQWYWYDVYFPPYWCGYYQGWRYYGHPYYWRDWRLSAPHPHGNRFYRDDRGVPTGNYRKSQPPQPSHRFHQGERRKRRY